MELEATRSQHTSFSSEPSENVLSVTSTPLSQSTGHLKELIPPSDPTQVAVLCSSVFEETEYWKSGSATEPSITDSETMVQPLKAGARGGRMDQQASCSASRSCNRETEKAGTQSSNLSDEMPCNIVDGGIYNNSAHDHSLFKSVKDSTGEAKTSNRSSKLEKGSTIYEVVSKEFTQLIVFQSSRTGFSHLTDNCFFDLYSLCLADSDQGQFSAVKMNISATKIEADEWQAPPGLQPLCIESFPPFACTFGLPEQARDEDIRKYAANFMCLIGGKMMFPYLTVDFRKNQEQLRTTIQRAAHNGTQSLYNRHRLYLRARERLGEAAKARDNNAFHSHFMIVFDKAKYEGWQIIADHDDRWEGKGCTMERVFSSDLLEAEKVRDLHRWIRCIHNWGAMTYGPACVKDIRTYLMVKE